MIIGLAVVVEVAHIVDAGFGVFVAVVDRARILVVAAGWGCADATHLRVARLDAVAQQAVAAARWIRTTLTVSARQTRVGGAVDAVIAVRVGLAAPRALRSLDAAVFVWMVEHRPGR
jgi:hypothetical protein